MMDEVDNAIVIAFHLPNKSKEKLHVLCATTLGLPYNVPLLPVTTVLHPALL